MVNVTEMVDDDEVTLMDEPPHKRIKRKHGSCVYVKTHRAFYINF